MVMILATGCENAQSSRGMCIWRRKRGGGLLNWARVYTETIKMFMNGQK